MSLAADVTGAPPSRATPAGPALLAGLGALLAALLMALATRALVPQSEDSVARSGAVLIVLGAAMLGAVVLARRRTLSVTEAGGLAILTLLVLLAAAYLVWALPAVLFRADILLWSESQYVSDIIKLRSGAPLYAPPADLSSSIYTPGTGILTWALASLLGASDSVPLFRAIQLGFAAIAALIASRSVSLVLALSGVSDQGGLRWAAIRTLVLFLLATNAVTNPFSHLLHNDALSLLVSAAAFHAVLRYARSRSRGALVAMAIWPTVGFLVKQSLGIWAPLAGLHLLAFDTPRSWRRIVGFGLGAGALLLAAYGACRLAWGPEFHYWTITALGGHPTSLLRSIEHVMDAWAFFALGIGAGVLLLLASWPSRLLGPWVIWLAFLAIEGYTSGIAWMLNHMGPGSLLAGVWGCAALQRWWPRLADRVPAGQARWLGTCAGVVAFALICSGLGAIHVPVPSVGRDADRYATAIEREFLDGPAAGVLLDMGSWPYLPDNVVMADRSAVVGDLGLAGLGDYSGILGRIRGAAYRRILVHDFESPDLLYDHAMWRQRSGIRQALQERYRVVRTIPGAAMVWRHPSLHTISVLEPRDPSPAGADSP